MKLFSRLANWFKELIRKKQTVTPANAVAQPERTPVVEVSRQPGLTCPECNTRIPISINSLLQQAPVICPGCQLILEVDAQQSKGALSALQKLQDGLKAAGKNPG